MDFLKKSPQKDLNVKGVSSGINWLFLRFYYKVIVYTIVNSF